MAIMIEIDSELLQEVKTCIKKRIQDTKGQYGSFDKKHLNAIDKAIKHFMKKERKQEKNQLKKFFAKNNKNEEK